MERMSHYILAFLTRVLADFWVNQLSCVHTCVVFLPDKCLTFSFDRSFTPKKQCLVCLFFQLSQLFIWSDKEEAVKKLLVSKKF